MEDFQRLSDSGENNLEKTNKKNWKSCDPESLILDGWRKDYHIFSIFSDTNTDYCIYWLRNIKLKH